MIGKNLAAYCVIVVFYDICLFVILLKILKSNIQNKRIKTYLYKIDVYYKYEPVIFNKVYAITIAKWQNIHATYG